MCPDLVNIRGFRNGIEAYCGTYNIRERLDSCRIGFSGDFSYKPNRDAAHFIINNLSPALSTYDKSFDIYLIGRNPDDLMTKAKSFRNVRIHVTNEVNSIDIWLEKLDIYICPLFSGAGMKNKILKAMSIGLPIISTRHGVDGIEEHVDGESYLGTDTDDIKPWITNIDLLINSHSIRSSMSSRGKKIVSDRYSWHSVASDIVVAVDSCSMQTLNK
jgi:glycosyltransferase involved in cell wall biosynthesis